MPKLIIVRLMIKVIFDHQRQRLKYFNKRANDPFGAYPGGTIFDLRLNNLCGGLLESFKCQETQL